MEDSIDSIEVHFIPLLFPSDHYSITFNLSFSKPPVKQATYYSYNYSKGDYQGLYEHLSYFNLSSCFLSHNVEFIWETIELIISDYSFLLPKFTVIINPIRHHIKCLHTLHRRHKRHPTRSLEEKIKLSEESLQEEIANSKTNELYLIREYASHDHNNNILKYIRNLTHSKNFPSVLHLDNEIVESDTDSVNMFNRYFHSVFSDSSEPSNVDNLLEPTDHIDSISITIEGVYDFWTLLKHQTLTLSLQKFFRHVLMCTNFVPTIAPSLFHVS